MQEMGNAWASRMIGLGNVFGYLMGYLDLVNIFPFFGDRQLKVLTVIGAISLVLTVAITSYCVVEKRIYNSDLEDYDLNPIQKTVKSLFIIFKTMFNLPGPIAKVCNTQFFSWMGWFPFMFYATVWVSEIEFDGKPPIDESLGGNDSVGDSTRTGSFALVIFSVVSLISSFVLPLIVKNKNNDNESNNSNNSRFNKYLLNLPQWFTLTLAMYGICMLCTTFVWTVTGATILIALCGIPWSVSMWAPFSLIAEHLRNQNLEHDQSAQTEEYRRLSDIVTEEHENDRDDDTVPLGAQIPTSNYLSRRANNPSDPPPRYSGTFEEDQPLTQPSDHAEEPQPPKSVDDAGMILGIHNIYIVIPQLLISLVGSIIFYIYEAAKSEGSGSGISAILKVAGLLSLVSSFVSLSIWKNKYP
jgi:solute carrier family 45 protein 1/2/4